MNLFKNANGKNVETNFAWLNEPGEWKFENKKLVVTAPSSSDFFIDQEGPSVRDTAPFFYTSAAGDFSLTTRINIDMNYGYDSGCLMIMVDKENWAKLCYENWMNEPAIVSVVTKKTSDDCPSYKIGNVRPYLKILRSDNNFGFHYSLDGEHWTIIRYFNMDVSKEIKVGIAAQCPMGEGCKMEFEFLDLVVGKVRSAKVVE